MVIPLLVIAAGLLAYHNSFTAPFIYDDVPSILTNLTIRHLWPIWRPLSPPHEGGITVEGRPVVNLSLAVNYALGDYNVWGYHAFNLTIHILAGLTLLGIVRRTLLQPRLRPRFGAAAHGLAVATAVLWTVHPLQTESVTYVVQRAESIMGLCYLLTLYCFIRGAESRRQSFWYGLSVIACALGMASKEVMVSAPLMVLLYDRTFLSGSFREACRRRWPLYFGLAAGWILLGFVLVSGQLPATTANARRLGLSWWQYLATEPGVILYYLRLSVWPQPLCLDYQGWPAAKTWASILPPTLVIALLLGATARAWKTNSPWGFLGAWFFLILAPSSSVIPLDSPAYEHRMYLSLAAVIVVCVLGIHALAARRTVAVAAVFAIGLGTLTWRRNQDFRSELAIWQDTVDKRPDNPRAHNGLGLALLDTDRVQEAIKQFEEAAQLNPDYAEPHCNLASALRRLGRLEEAMRQCEAALRIRPDYAEADNNLGNVLFQAGKVPEAIQRWQEALRLNPDLGEVHNNLAVALVQQGRLPEAVAQFEQALSIRPDDARTHYNLGFVLEQSGMVEDAIKQYRQALRINPDLVQAQNGLERLRAGR